MGVKLTSNYYNICKIAFWCYSLPKSFLFIFGNSSWLFSLIKFLEDIMRDEKHISPRQQRKIDGLNERYNERYGVSYDAVQEKLNAQKKKGKGFKNTLKILKYMGENKKYYVISMVFLLFAVVFALIMPVAFQHIVDDITNSSWTSAINWTILWAIGCSMMYVCYWAYRVIVAKGVEGTAHNLREKLSDAILHTKKNKFDSINSGEVITRLSSDPKVISSSIDNVLGYSMDTLENFLFMVYIFIIDWRLASILFLSGFVMFITRFAYLKIHQKRNQRRSDMIGDDATGMYGEMVRGNSDVKNLNLTGVLKRKVMNRSINLKNSDYDRVVQNTNYSKIGQILNGIFSAVFIVISILFLKNNLVTLGVVLMMFSHRWYVPNFFDFINIIYEQLNIVEVKAERVNEILDDEAYPKESFGTKTIKNPKGNIEFKNVTFRYDDKKELFKDLSFKINAGETIGIVGKSGQGKSTIINLISKTYEVNKGKILIDGVNINDLTKDALRGSMAIVPQTPYIFNMTIRENLLFAKADATEEELIEVCKKAQIYDYIQSMPDKFESKIGEGGIMLSGGQRQRLAIARALLKDSKILLLDEATSALDNESQGKIKKVIHDLGKERTVIIVAHRLTTIVDCDRILVMDENTIKADGKHKDLMKSSKEYRNLYKSEDDE